MFVMRDILIHYMDRGWKMFGIREIHICYKDRRNTMCLLSGRFASATRTGDWKVFVSSLIVFLTKLLISSEGEYSNKVRNTKHKCMPFIWNFKLKHDLLPMSQSTIP